VPCQNGATTATTVNNSLVSIVGGGGSSPLRRARARHTYWDKNIIQTIICRQSMGRGAGGGDAGVRSPLAAVYRHKAYYYYYYVRTEFYGRAPSSVLSSSAPAISINFFHFANRVRRPTVHCMYRWYTLVGTIDHRIIYSLSYPITNAGI